MNGRDRLRDVALGAIALGLAACGPPPPPPPLVPEGGDEAPAAEILRALRERSVAISPFAAGLELVWEDPHLEGPESCRASVSWSRPDRLRLRGHTAAFFTVFDLVADGTRVWLDIPREELLVHGRIDDPAWSRLPFPPDLLRVALLADPCPEGGCDGPVRWSEEDGLPRIVGPDWTLELNVESRLPTRYVSGTAEIRWSEWADRRGTAWPGRLEIRTAREGAVLRIGVGRVEEARNLPGSRFSLEVEESREILTPEEAVSRWESAAPGPPRD
jgi:hypothetical protein